MVDFHFTLDKSITQGDDRTIKLIFEDTTISSWEFFYTAKRNFTQPDSEAAIRIDSTDIQKTDSGVGFIDTATIELTSTLTGIEPGDYLHDIKVIKATGTIQTIAKGKLIIEGHQTQRTS